MSINGTFWLAAVVIMFAAGCNYAPPPKPIADGAATAKGGNPGPKAPGAVIAAKNIAGVSDMEIGQPDGKQFKFADYNGKVLLVDIWATYCPPCREQAPKLAALNSKYKSRGFAVVGLNIDDEKDRDLVKRFIAEAGINYTVAYASEKMTRAFLDGTEDETGSPPIPQLFLISREGRVVEHLIGNDPRHTLSQLEEIIARQLN